jgi:hypothetical protein
VVIDRDNPVTVMERYKLKELRELLKVNFEKWVEYSCKYSKNEDYKDCVYWHNERAVLSLYSAACVLNECYILEEYPVEKTSEKETNRPGRVDLYVCKNSISYILEVSSSM